MRALIAFGLVCWSAAASAAWQTTATTDQMSDKRSTIAVLDATNGGAALRVRCDHGSAFPEVVFASVVGFDRVDMSYRFDSGSIVAHAAGVSTEGRIMWVWLHEPKAAIDHIRQAKQLRLQVFPIAEPSQFYSFDLAGAADALASISCH